MQSADPIRTRTPRTPHTPPSHSPHGNTATRQHGSTKRKRAVRHEGIQHKGDWTIRDAGPNSKTGNTMKKTGTTRDRGTTQQHATPAIQRDHHTNRRGTPQTRREASSTPALPYHATLPSTMAPPSTTTRGGVNRGYPTTRTAQTHTHHPHTTHPARNSARHTLQYSPALHRDE